METKLTKRLEFALQKLYLAYTNATLHPECACNCAAGNVCDNRDAWKHFTDSHGSLQLNYIGKVHQSFGRKINGYLPIELLTLEAHFLKGCGYQLPFRYNHIKPIDPKERDIQFKGLYAAISYLCALDNVDNVMDIMQCFKEEIKSSHNLELTMSF